MLRKVFWPEKYDVRTSLEYYVAGNILICILHLLLIVYC